MLETQPRPVRIRSVQAAVGEIRKMAPELRAYTIERQDSLSLGVSDCRATVRNRGYWKALKKAAVKL